MSRKPIDKWQFGDFQTPDSLAEEVVDVLVRNHNLNPQLIIEPTCGKGAFVRAALKKFPDAQIVGIDVNSDYIGDAVSSIQHIGNRANASIMQGDFFNIDWRSILEKEAGELLILGNPPWVTNSELGLLRSSNVPLKSNFQNRRGIQAITGYGNFDISEWMLLQHVNWILKREGAVAVLCKYAVARKIIKQLPATKNKSFHSHVYPIDAKSHFNASVEACLFVLTADHNDVSNGNCKVYGSLDAEKPSQIIGERDGYLIHDIVTYDKWRHLRGQDLKYIWRSGIKHDCSKVMELETCREGFKNGFGRIVILEKDFLFPLLKSSDVANARTQSRRVVLVPQRTVGDDTSIIKDMAPKTYNYLTSYRELLEGRKSSIYRGKPLYSIFGVGDYTFKPWKLAISGLYKQLKFCLVGPKDGKAVVFDDTVVFLAFDSEEEARFVNELVVSEPAIEFLGSMIFWDEKRPITTQILRRLSIKAIAEELGLVKEYERFVRETARLRNGQLELGIAERGSEYQAIS